MYKFIFQFFLLFLFPLYSHLRFELVTNGICDIEHYKRILREANREENIVACDLLAFKGIHKKKGKIQNFFQQFSPSISIDKDIRKLIFMNIPSKANQTLYLEKLPKEKMVLFMWEPPVRLRKMYGEKIQNCFSKIYTWNDDLVDGKKYFKFYYPNKKEMIDDIPSFEEKKFLTLICGNTTDKSRHHPNELYSHRILAIEFFQKQKDLSFEFYGRNWNPANYPSYRGEITNKIAVNKQYKFSICYENCRDLPGYITEKIFDCFAAGSIPIYWGASNITNYIPKECFIDRREFPTLESLLLFLKAMKKEEYYEYIERIRAFLQSDQAALFSPEHYEKIFLQALD